MAKKYGWSDKQLARINAARAERGAKLLDVGPMSNEYIQAYSDFYSRRKKRGIEGEEEDQIAAETPRLEEYYGKQRERIAQRGPKVISSPFAKMTGGIA